jgi:hypothetical protein
MPKCVIERARSRTKSSARSDRRSETSFARRIGLLIGGAAFCTLGLGAFGVSTAFASSAIAFHQGSARAAVPDGFSEGTYNWFENGSEIGTITYEDYDWVGSVDGDSGYFLTFGRVISMSAFGGTAGAGGCIFAGKISKAGTSIGSASKPGAWICPGYGTSGTWYAVEVTGSTRGAINHGGNSEGPFKESSETATVHNGLVVGTYNIFLDGDEDGTITFTSSHTFTMSEGDSGTWVAAGKSFAMSITGGSDELGDCLFAGKLNKAGTGIDSSANPGNWACFSISISGTWYTS